MNPGRTREYGVHIHDDRSCSRLAKDPEHLSWATNGQGRLRSFPDRTYLSQLVPADRSYRHPPGGRQSELSAQDYENCPAQNWYWRRVNLLAAELSSDTATRPPAF